jgi:hypothetical protein
MPDVALQPPLQLLQQDLHTTKDLVILEIVLVIISVISIIVLQCLGLRGSHGSANVPREAHRDLEKGLGEWLRAREGRDEVGSREERGRCRSASPSLDSVDSTPI